MRSLRTQTLKANVGSAMKSRQLKKDFSLVAELFKQSHDRRSVPLAAPRRQDSAAVQFSGDVAQTGMTTVAHISNDGPQVLCALLGACLDRGHSFLVPDLLAPQARGRCVSACRSRRGDTRRIFPWSEPNSRPHRSPVAARHAHSLAMFTRRVSSRL
jgi:hypothetical protein